MKKAELEKLKPYIGQKVKATARRVTAIYEVEGELLDVITETTPDDRRCLIRIKVSEPRDEVGKDWTIHYSGIELIFSTHLIKVKTDDGRVFK